MYHEEKRPNADCSVSASAQPHHAQFNSNIKCIDNDAFRDVFLCS